MSATSTVEPVVAAVEADSAEVSPPSTSNTPVLKTKHGNINAAAWAQEVSTKEGVVFTRYSIALDRSYKDKTGEWQNTKSLYLSEYDLDRLALTALDMLEQIRKRKNENK